VDQAYESASLNELLAAPPSALQGLAPWWVQWLQQRKQYSMLLLPAQHAASRACIKMLHLPALVVMLWGVSYCVPGPVLALCCSRTCMPSLQWYNAMFGSSIVVIWCRFCAACRTDGALQQLKIKNVSDLAKWKYAGWADALVTLAEYEREDVSSR
jgi:hypothetical protein